LSHPQVAGLPLNTVFSDRGLANRTLKRFNPAALAASAAAPGFY
jgi:hypothetical protein